MIELRESLSAAASSVTAYAPRVAGTVALVLGAWLVARIARVIVVRIGERVALDRKLHSEGVSVALGSVAWAAVWLFALPAILEAIGLQTLREPISAMMAKLSGFLPNLLGSIAVLVVGVLVAGVVRQLVSGLFSAAGSEKLAQKMGIATALGPAGLAGVASKVVFALILLPVVAAALQPLQLDSVTQPVSRLLETVMALIPRLIVAAVIVAIAALIGRALGDLVRGLLFGIGFDAAPRRLGLQRTARPGSRTASELAGQLVAFTVVYIAFMQACEVIGFGVLTESVSQLGAALVRMATGLALMVVGLWLAAVASGAILSSCGSNARVLAYAARGAVLFLAAALALRQMGLPSEIVAMAFGSVVFALAVAFALAVGFGGRGVAATLLEQAARPFVAPSARSFVAPTSEATPEPASADAPRP